MGETLRRDRHQRHTRTRTHKNLLEPHQTKPYWILSTSSTKVWINYIQKSSNKESLCAQLCVRAGAFQTSLVLLVFIRLAVSTDLTAFYQLATDYKTDRHWCDPPLTHHLFLRCAVGLENGENGTGEIFDEKVEEAVVTKNKTTKHYLTSAVAES